MCANKGLNLAIVSYVNRKVLQARESGSKYEQEAGIEKIGGLKGINMV